MRILRVVGLILTVYLLSADLLFAQEEAVFLDSLDSLTEQAKLITESDPSQLRDPKKAALFSAVLPGLGQVYNRKYWKVPLIYTGFIALGYWIDWNNDVYNQYRSALYAIIDGNPDTPNPYPGYSEDQIRQITDEFRRNRDVLIILTGVLYALNIVDAHVDAHLKEFDINEDLALSLKPASVNAGIVNGAGLGLTLRIK